jgi:hypothetical protein
VGRLDGKGPDRTDSTLTQNRGKDFRLKPVARHVVLQPAGDRLRIVHGFRRLRSAVEAGVKAIRCRVIKGVDDHTAAMISARVNLTDGQPLTVSEKRHCFHRELEARNAADLPDFSGRAWARVYHVAAKTIKSWRETANKTTEAASPEGGGAQIGHPTADGTAEPPPAEATTTKKSKPRKAKSKAATAAPSTPPAEPGTAALATVLELRAAVELLHEGMRGKTCSADERAGIESVIQILQSLLADSEGKEAA